MHSVVHISQPSPFLQDPASPTLKNGALWDGPDALLMLRTILTFHKGPVCPAENHPELAPRILCSMLPLPLNNNLRAVYDRNYISRKTNSFCSFLDKDQTPLDMSWSFQGTSHNLAKVDETSV